MFIMFIMYHYVQVWRMRFTAHSWATNSGAISLHHNIPINSVYCRPINSNRQNHAVSYRTLLFTVLFCMGKRRIKYCLPCGIVVWAPLGDHNPWLVVAPRSMTAPLFIVPVAWYNWTSSPLTIWRHWRQNPDRPTCIFIRMLPTIWRDSR